jgi:hypothetical protein
MFVSLSKISKCVALVWFIFIIFASLTTTLNVLALDFVKPDAAGNVNVSDPKTNLTVSGGQVDVSSKTSKDLIAAGSNVSIAGEVERNLIAAGGNLNIQSPKIGATVRIAGGNINLKNTVIEEDLVVAGGTVTLTNVQVKGDTYMASGNLNVTNSSFLGSANVRYGMYTGDDLSKVVKGKLDSAQNSKLIDTEKYEEDKNKNAWDIFWPADLGILYGLILLLVFLSSKKALGRFEDVKFDSRFWLNMLIGFAAIFLTPAIFLFSILILGFTFTGSLLTLVYSMFSLAIAFLPFYIAKLLINTFKVRTTVVITSFIVWFLLFINSILSNVFPIFWIVSLLAFLVHLSTFGYIINHILSITNAYFNTKNTEDTELA